MGAMNLSTKVSADEDDFPCFSTFMIIIPIDCKITFFFILVNVSDCYAYGYFIIVNQMLESVKITDGTAVI